MQRIVIKVGSTSISDKASLNLGRMRALISLINELMQDNEVILVSSAAISAGCTKLDIDRKNPLNRQVLSTIGQPYLMTSYNEILASFGYAGDRSHRNVRADPGFVDQHESAVQYVDLTVLEEDHGSAIF